MLMHRSSSPISEIPSEMEQLLNDVVAPFARSTFGNRRDVPVDVFEDEQSFYLDAEIPGVKMEDLEILANGDEVTLKGKWPKFELHVESWHRRERRGGEFSRVIKLPTKVDFDQVDASIKNGVLSIVLPKAAECRPRKIEVRNLK